MRSRTPVSVVAAAAVSLIAAACGSGSPSIAKLGSSKTHATTTAQTGLLAYSQCMRSHGVPRFPDPTPSQGIPKDELEPVVSSPKFQPASNACQHLMPATGLAPQSSAQQTSTRVADELSFATCMHSHGVIHFPDPTAQGELSIAMVQAQGVNVHSPAVLRVVERCLPASHGALTAAKVAQALHDIGG